MNLLTDIIRRDGEYTQLHEAVRENLKPSVKPLPLLVNGLCDGASDAFIISLIEDVHRDSKGTASAALIICPEEKNCVRMKDTLRRFGLRCGFFVARDLSFYQVTASHEYEHERLKVLSGLATGAYDAIVATPDNTLSRSCSYSCEAVTW